MYYTDDPVRDFECWDRDRERALEQLPVCECCGEHIQQEDAVRIGGDWYCDECINGMREEIWDEEF